MFSLSFFFPSPASHLHFSIKHPHTLSWEYYTMFQCKAHLVMRLIENRISMEFMLQVGIQMLMWNIKNSLSSVAFLFIKESSEKNRTGYHRIAFAVSVLAGLNKHLVIWVRMRLAVILIHNLQCCIFSLILKSFIGLVNFDSLFTLKACFTVPDFCCCELICEIIKQ